MRTCEHCGTEYQTAYPQQKYCNPKCSYQAKEQRRKTYTPPTNPRKRQRPSRAKKPQTPQLKPLNYTHCIDCDQPMRPRRTPARDHPGTLRQGVRKRCADCHAKTINPNNLRICQSCDQTMRPAHTLQENWPNTVTPHTPTLCGMCWRAEQSELTPPPDANDLDTMRARASLGYYINDRRLRGVPLLGHTIRTDHELAA